MPAMGMPVAAVGGHFRIARKAGQAGGRRAADFGGLGSRPAEETEEFLQEINLREALEPIEIEGFADLSFEQRKSIGNKQVLAFDPKPNDKGGHEGASPAIGGEVTIGHDCIEEIKLDPLLT